MTDTATNTNAAPGERLPAAERAIAWWRRRSKWFRRITLFAVIVAVLQPIVGFFGVPLIVRKIVVPQIEKRLNGTVRLADAQFNPYTWRLGLDQLVIANNDGHESLGFTRAEIDFNPLSSLFLPGWRFNDIILVDPFVDAINARETGLNLAAFVKTDLTSSSTPPSFARAPRLIVGSIEIRDGRGKFDDRTFANPVVMQVGGVSFRVENLDTRPTDENFQQLVATTDTGARIEWQGTLSLDPPASRGTLVIKDLALPRFAAYATRLTDATVTEGRLSALVNYHLAPLPRSVAPGLDKNGQPLPPPPAIPAIVRATVSHAAISGLVTERDGKPLAAIPSVELYSADVDAIARSVVVNAVALDHGSLVVDRDDQGDFNLARMIRERPASTASAAPPTEPVARRPRVDPSTLADPAQQLLTSVSYLLEDFAGAWSVTVGRIDITNQSIDFADRSTSEPVIAALRDLTLRAGPVRTSDGFVFPLDVSTSLNGAASSLGGTFSVATRSIDVDVSTDHLALAPFGPYVRLVPMAPFATTRILGGSANARGHLLLATPEPTRIDGRWKGELAVDGLRSEEINTHQSVLALTLFQTDGAADLTFGTHEGVSAAWTGALKGSASRAGPALIDALGLGAGDVGLDTIDVNGHAQFARPPGGDAHGTWEGTLALDGVVAADLAAGGAVGSTLAATAKRVALDATADLTIAEAGGASARWKGVLTLADVAADASGAAAAHGSLAQFSLDGAARVGVSKDRVLSVGWDGDASVAGASASLPESELDASAASVALKGAAELVRSDDNPAKIDWKGSASIDGGRLKRGVGSDGANVLELTSDRLAIDGTFGVKALPGSDVLFDLAAAIDIAAPSIATPGALGVAAGAGDVSLKGTAQGTLARDGTRVSWDATTALKAFRAKDASPDSTRPSVTGDSITINGRGSLALAETERSAEWQGTAKASETRIDAPALAGATQAVIGAADADGALQIKDGADGLFVKWNGKQGAERVDVKAGDLGGPTHATLGSLSGTSDLEASIRNEHAHLSWTGELGLRDASAATGEARSVKAATISIDGTATADLASTSEPLATDGVAWTGNARAGGLDIVAGSGTTKLAAGGQAMRFKGSLEARPSQGTPVLTVHGDLAMDEAHAARGEPAPMIGTVRSIELTELSFDQAASQLAAQRLAIVGAAIDGEVAEPKSSKGVEGASPQPQRTAKSLAEQLPWAVRLSEFSLRDGEVRLTGTADGSAGGTDAAGRTTVTLDQVAIDASDISTDRRQSDPNAPPTGGAIKMTGRLVGSGRVGLLGTFDPFRSPMVADVQLTIDNAPIPPTNPIASRYLGWQIAAGRFSTQIPMTMRNGGVDGTLTFLLDGVELGARSKSPDAPNLPLDFALAILTDSKGQVRGTIPFSGDATSPDFSISGLIVEVIFSFIGKIATAPFQLIASAIGGAGDIDLSMVPFPPGSADVDADSLKVIDLLSKAMQERPGFHISALGQYDPMKDDRALRLALLNAQVADRARDSFPSHKTVDAALYKKFVTAMWKESPAGVAAKGAKALPAFETMETSLLATMPLERTALRELAQRRAESVAAAFRGAGIAEGRVTAAIAPDDAIEQMSPRAAIDLGLKGAPAGAPH